MKQKRKQLIAFLLIIILIVKIPESIIASNYSSTLGTNKALGSPLINENFITDNWNPWEMLCFGIFLSNFTQPFVDDYESAFSKASSYGSKGKGVDALVFGAGSDSNTQAALEPMLNYCVNAQKSEAREIVADFYKFDDSGLGAKVMVLDEESEAKTPLKGSKYESYYKLYVKGTGGNWELIWDNTNDNLWCSEMQAAIIANQEINGSDSMVQNYKDITGSDTIGFKLDMFGNICADKDGRLIVIIPAACNPYLTKSLRFNMVNRAVFSQLYGTASGEDLIKYTHFETKDTIEGVLADGMIKSSGDGKDRKKILFVTISEPGGATPGGLGKIYAGDAFCYFDSGDYVGYKSKDVPDSVLGNALQALMGSDINSKTGNGLPLNFVVADSHMLKDGDKYTGTAAATYRFTLLKEKCNCTRINPVKIYADLWTKDGVKNLFADPVYVVNNYDDSSYKEGSHYLYRLVVNNAMQYADGNNGSGSGSVDASVDMPSREVLRASLVGTSVANIHSILFKDSNGYATPVFRNTLMTSNKVIKPSDTTMIKSESATPKDLMKYFSVEGGKEQKGYDTDAPTSNKFRVLKIYPKNPLFVHVADVMDLSGSANFDVYTPFIYVTYLQYFNLIGDASQTKEGHDFNENIFSKTSDFFKTTGEDVTGYGAMTEEEKKADLMNSILNIIHPQTKSAKEFRATWLNEAIASLCHKWYNGLVFGNSSGTNFGTYTTRSTAGFLRIEAYDENFLTSWFLNVYARYALLILGILLLAVMIIGVMSHKSFAWYILSLLTVVNLVLAIPSLGEIAPYISNRAIEKLFEGKLNYWLMSESIENAQLEKEYDLGGANETELGVASLVRQLNVVFLDRSLMIKSDISKKVLEDNTGVINEIQSMDTTAWLLPILMRQFTATDGTKDYVYTTVGDMYDNMTNLYWWYVPSDKLTTETVLAGSVTKSSGEDDYSATVLNNKEHYYANYISTDAPDDHTVSESYYCNNRVADCAFSGVNKSEATNVHTAFYFLDFANLSNDSTKDVAFNKYEYTKNGRGKIDYTWTDIADLDVDIVKQAEITMEELAQNYKSTDGAEQCYGFLWMTENVMPYMYTCIKDTFGSALSVSNLTEQLQGAIVDGYYQKTDDGGVDYDAKATVDETDPNADVDLDTYEYVSNRVSFMHAGKTGYIRDVCDMREMFTNVIPYMYSVILSTGGDDGDGGLFGDSKMKNFPLYENNNKSWFLRSNWVIKLMENDDLTRTQTISDSEGNMHEISNPIDPASYPDERPMIFSEAEMHARGLKRSQLTLVENKILDFNEAVERDWTMLLNYVNVEGVTTELLYRQMALSATLDFNKTFTTNRLVNPKTAMYPQTVDLRHISFDSVVRLLLVNSTRNTSFVYSDAVLNVMTENGIMVTLLILVMTAICVGLIPIMRVFIMAALFYLSYLALIKNLLAEDTTRFKITAGYFISTLIFLALNLLYYGVYAMMISTSSVDEVLSLSNSTASAGAPIAQFTGLLVCSILYVIGAYRFAKFIIINHRDMGFERYTEWASAAYGKITSAFQAVGEKHFSGVNKYFSQIAPDRSKSPVGGKGKFNDLHKGRQPAHHNTTNIDNGDTITVTQDNRKHKTNNQISQEEYNYNQMLNIMNGKDVEASSESIRQKVNSGAEKVNAQQSPQKGNINRQSDTPGKFNKRSAT